MTDSQIIKELFANIEADIIADQKSKGIRASGKSAESFRHEIDEDDTFLMAELWGADYFRFQETGRGKTKSSSGDGFYSEIEQWIKDKGIKGDDDISDESLTFLIYRKINEEGTDIFQKKRRGLSLVDLINVNMFSLLGQLRFEKRKQYEVDIVKMFDIEE